MILKKFGAKVLNIKKRDDKFQWLELSSRFYF